jgi:ergothioneine biosynthesis protein EgtB
MIADELLDRFLAARQETERLASGLTDEDQCVQSMPDASPAKWHRAHTTWFFEQFVLVPYVPGYRVFDSAFSFLFNSYYDAVGDRHPRPSRGLLTRPGARRVTDYRGHVDAALRRAACDLPAVARQVVELGIQHEQQHQELLLTDVLHGFAANPLDPAVLPDWREPEGEPAKTVFIEYSAGLHRIGHDGPGFCFDNEGPAHQVWLGDHAIASRLVRNSDWLAFIEDQGYCTPSLWMSEGWAAVHAERWEAPLYWRKHDGVWYQFGPGGLARLSPEAPVRHVSWYEADAFARWSDARLPSEAEWEAASGLSEKTGLLWQWTESAYRPYPGFRPEKGAIGEYNGKFMINQMVLRGGSFGTAAGHTRQTYRNFFHPDKRWQFSGLRLAKDL